MKWKLNTRDLVNIAVFGVGYFVIMFAGGMMSLMGPAFTFVGETLSALINATVFMLLILRVPKFGAVTILSVIVGLGMMTGHSVWALVAAAISGFIADLVVTDVGRAQGVSPRRAVAGYAIVQLWLIAPFMPIILNADAYFASIEERMGSDYVQSVRSVFSLPVIGLWAVCVVIIGAIAGAIAIRIARKHFVRAGLTR